MAGIEARMAGLESRMTSLGERQSNLERRLDETNKKIDEMSKKIERFYNTSSLALRAPAAFIAWRMDMISLGVAPSLFKLSTSWETVAPFS